jgi:hypothetical protein
MIDKEKMEMYCLTCQSQQRAVGPMEEELIQTHCSMIRSKRSFAISSGRL